MSYCTRPFSPIESAPHGTSLSARFTRISSRAMWRGTVRSGSGFGRRLLARGSIRPGRCGNLSVAMLVNTMPIMSDIRLPGVCRT